MTAHLPVLTVITPLVVALTIPILGFLKNRLHYYAAMIAIAVTTVFSVLLLLRTLTEGVAHYYFGGWKPPWGITYSVDPLSAFIALIVLIVGFAVGVYSKNTVEFELKGRTVAFYTLYLLLITGLLGILMTGDLFNVYVFLEITSLAVYTLIAVGRSRHALIASFDYLILGTIAASFILLGIGYLYMMTGTLNMADLAQRLPAVYSSKVVMTALVFFIIGFGIKIALFPMHTWLPNAYTHAPIAVIPLIAGVVTKVGVYALIRVIFTIFGIDYVFHSIPATTFLAYGGALATVAGAVLALMQKDIRRMLGYSSISQIGLIIVGIGIANNFALIGSVIHILGHAIMKSSLFMVTGAVNFKHGITHIRGYEDLFKKMPLTMLFFGLIVFSMVGIPPSIGFTSKFYLTLGAIRSGDWFLTTVIVGSGLLTLAYFWRLIELIFFAGVPGNSQTRFVSNSQTGSVKTKELPPSMLYPIGIFAILCILLGIFTLLPISVVKPAVQSLIAGVR